MPTLPERLASAWQMLRVGVPSRLSPWLIAAVSLALATRLVLLVHRHAVNVLFYDQWDFYAPLFNGADWLTMFRWQHGPHRQGCGLFVTWAVAALSGWNTRAESFAILALVMVALGLALVLKRWLGGRWQASDVIVPLLFLAPVQFEVFVGTPNPAHGALPLLLLMAYVLAWCAPNRTVRLGGVLFLNFLLIYTGFGVFVGLITPAILAVVWYREYRADDRAGAVWSAAAWAAALLSGASFAIGYTFQPAAPGFAFRHPRLHEYPWFAALMLGNFWGAKGLIGGTLLGAMMGGALLTAACHHGYRWLRGHSSIDLAIAILTGFSLLFCINTAYGRVGLGLEAARASRYATYLIPGFLGLYFHVLTLDARTWRPIVLAGAVLAVVLGCVPVHPDDAAGMEWYSRGKREWTTAYRATGSVEEADRFSRFKIYPCPEQTHLSRKLNYLKERNLNLFRTRCAPGEHVKNHRKRLVIP